MPDHRRKKGGILNKGVSHGIKKPKPKPNKAKEKQKQEELARKKQKMEETAKKIKERAPRIPANRSPVKSPKSPTKHKKRLQVLSPPGVSLLNGEVPKESFLPEPTSGKFFTSRSRAAATVQISKNIKLSAKYGDVSLNQKAGKSFAKKNIGRLVEEKLDQYLQRPGFSKEIDEVSLLPSVASNPRPVPTRVPSTPSPTKKTPQRKARIPSPKKKVSHITSATKEKPLDTSLGEELEDMELILKDWDKDKDQEDTSVSKYNSPKKLNGALTPVRRSPRKLNGCASPVRKSPRKHMSESHTPQRESPRKRQEAVTPSNKPHINQAKADTLKLEKGGASPARKSPRKLERSTPKKHRREEEEEQVKPESPSKKVKYFPIFYPKTRLSDCKFPRGKTGRSSDKFAAEMDEDQMMIDAGQKEFGAKQCPTCGLVFELGNPSDETSHRDYHDHLLTALKYTGWKKENLVREPDHLGGRVIVVSGQDSQHWWQKVEEVREVVDNELGFSENSIRTREHTKVFLYVLDRRVVGCLIAEKIDKAYRVVPQELKSEGSGRLVCCSQDPTKVWVGISRVWVLQAKRGKGIATTLVDAMRQNMVESHILSKDHIAFSDPTEAGMSFAEQYVGRPDFLVYRREF